MSHRSRAEAHQQNLKDEWNIPATLNMSDPRQSHHFSHLMYYGGGDRPKEETPDEAMYERALASVSLHMAAELKRQEKEKADAAERAQKIAVMNKRMGQFVENVTAIRNHRYPNDALVTHSATYGEVAIYAANVERADEKSLNGIQKRDDVRLIISPADRMGTSLMDIVVYKHPGDDQHHLTIGSNFELINSSTQKTWTGGPGYIVPNKPLDGRQSVFDPADVLDYMQGPFDEASILLESVVPTGKLPVPSNS